MEYWLAWFHEGNDQVKAVAKAAEQMGFAGVAISDHVAIPKDYVSVHPSGQRHIHHNTRFPDALITAATMAAVTDRLQFMTYVYVLTMREPFSVAKQVATLAMQSDYRFNLGVGAGWNRDEVELLGHPWEGRGGRMDEMIAIMRDFWEDGECSFQGKHFQFPLTGQYPVPTQPLPVWIGGKSPAALRRAARNDGWLGMNYPMEEIKTLVEQLNRARHEYEDQHGLRALPFRRFVIPDTLPSAEVYRQLEDWGVDSTVAMCWTVDDPAALPLEAKLEAMEKFADTYIRR